MKKNQNLFMKYTYWLYCLIVVCTLSVNSAIGQQRTYNGIVTEGEGDEPMIGAFVLIANTTRGVSTSLSGEFSIQAAPTDTLVISYIGCQTQKLPLAGIEGKINVKLVSDDQSLNEVVVVAYGVRRKGTIAGSVSNVAGDKMENIPAPSFDQALQGQVTGLTVTSNSGDPSAAADFSIRGTNSINSGTQPLFILDGTPISSADFNTINPNDIESVSVLKDASSTSIYGARAANGVIIITSKRGKWGDKPMITLRTQAGISQIAYGNWNIMNTAERIEYEKQIGLDSGKNYENLSRTDVRWVDEVFNNYAPLQNYDISVSGAKENFSYFISGNLYDQKGVAIDTYFKRAGMRANFDVKASEWLKVGNNTMFTYENYSEAIEGQYTTVTPISAARFMMPYYSPYNEDGSLASVNDGSWEGTGENPIEWSRNNPLDRNQYKLLLQPFVEVSPIKGLKFRSQFGFDYTQVTSDSRSLPSYLPNNGSGKAAIGSSVSCNLSITNTLTYDFSLENTHRFTVLLGQEGVDSSLSGYSVSTYGQKNDLLTNLSSGVAASSWKNSQSAYSFLSYFSRVDYHFDNRLFIDASLRGDASSRFGKNNRWAIFWAIGAMYDFKDSDFVRDNGWLDSFQLATSMGTSGNSSIPNYEHLALVGSGSDYIGDASMIPISRAKENLSWEQTLTNNLSVRVGLFSRLQFNLEFYNKYTSNMLMNVPIAPSANQGFMFEWQNVGGMINRGTELSANLNLLATKNFRWDVSANISYNYNKITELYSGVNEYEMSQTSTKLVVGKPVGSFFLNRYAGVNPLNGDALWYDKDGEITNEMKVEDKVLLDKNYIAPWQGGFGTSMIWKGFSLNAQFSWVADRWVMNNDRFFDESNGRFASYNQSNALLDRWQKPGDISSIPRHGEFSEFDTRLLENASFLRLKSLSFSYNLPKKWLGNGKIIRGLRVYAQGQNLLTFTNFSGLDPEGSNNLYASSYPMTRQYTFGLDFNF